MDNTPNKTMSEHAHPTINKPEKTYEEAFSELKAFILKSRAEETVTHTSDEV